jgi:hypothetical protein
MLPPCCIFRHPAHYKAKPPLDVLMETVSPTRTILETVELPPNEIGDLQSVRRRVRLKWNSLSLDDRLNGVAVRAVSSAGESLCAYTLTDFACGLYKVERPTWGVHVPAAKIYLKMVG